MMPNDLQPGMVFTYWPDRQWKRIINWAGMSDPEAPACLDVRVGTYWSREITKVIPGTVEPYKINTSVFYEFGNLLLDPSKTCEVQGLEVSYVRGTETGAEAEAESGAATPG